MYGNMLRMNQREERERVLEPMLQPQPEIPDPEPRIVHECFVEVFYAYM
jgi:hypothetical protein